MSDIKLSSGFLTKIMTETIILTHQNNGSVFEHEYLCMFKHTFTSVCFYKQAFSNLESHHNYVALPKPEIKTLIKVASAQTY